MRLEESHVIIEKVELEKPFMFISLDKLQPSESSANAELHRHHYYEILIAVEAQGKHKIDFTEYPLRSNSIHLVAPGQVHSISFSKPSTGFVFCFTKNFLHKYCMRSDQLDMLELFGNHHDVTPISISDTQKTKILPLMQELAENNNSEDPLHLLILGSQLKVLLLRIAQCKLLSTQKEALTDNRKTEIVRLFHRELEMNFKTLHKVSDYAEILSLTANYLNEVLKTETGVSAKDIIQKRIILEAKRLALCTNLNMKEISQQLCFDDIAHFSKFFKRLEGNNFKTFRKQLPQTR